MVNRWVSFLISENLSQITGYSLLSTCEVFALACFPPLDSETPYVGRFLNDSTKYAGGNTLDKVSRSVIGHKTDTCHGSFES